jgi:hypothetical protein
MIKKTGENRTETVPGGTSLPLERADAGRLLALVRGNEHIEKQSHGVQNVTCSWKCLALPILIRRGSSKRPLGGLCNIKGVWPTNSAEHHPIFRRAFLVDVASHAR